MYLYASVAAIAPSLLAVTICLSGLLVQSPAAYIPFIFVSILKVYVNMYCTDILAVECLLHSRDTAALDPRRLGLKPNDCLHK